MKKACILFILVTLVFFVCLTGVFIYRLQPYGGAYLSISDILQNHPGVYPQKININSATAEQLQTLPGIGPSIAEEIVAYRQEKGPFRSVNELEQVRGIGKEEINAIIPYVSIGG